MSISIGGIPSMLNTSTVDSVSNNKASSLQNTLGGVSSETSEEELMQICKDFESYFVEEILKEVRENMKADEDEDEDPSLSTMTDFYMDTTIETIADQLVDEIGGSYTQQLFEQMKRNYGIE